MSQVLNRRAGDMEKKIQMKQKFLGVLVATLVVITATSVILTLIVIFIIPKFDEMFTEMDLGEMPFLAAVLMGVAKTIAKYWYLFIFIPCLLWGLIRFLGKAPKTR